MKKITLLFMLCSVALLTKANIIIDELFDYDVSNLVNEASWTHSGTMTTGTGRNIETGGLVYSNAGGIYIHSGLGKKINHDYSAGTNYISYRAFPSVSTGSIYLSFLYQGNGDQGQTASEILGLSHITTNSALKPWAGKQADQTKNPFRLGVTRSSTTGGDIQWITSTVDKNNVYLIVVKYDFSLEKASLYINPEIASTTEPTPDAFDDSKSTPRSPLSYLMFKHNGSSVAKFYISGVRVSTTWDEAVAKQSTADPLSKPVVGSASSVTADGFTANWTAVVNAVGYDVNVYLGSNLVSTTNVNGQSVESLEISGLMSGIPYTYQVIAKGDVENFSDSDPSDASAEFSTLDPYATNTIHTDFGDETWGEIATSLTSGSYGSSSVNGFDLISASLYTGTTRGIKGETHTNRIAIDKLATGGKVSFPTVNSIEQIEIHAVAGTAGNGFQLKEFIPSTNSWNAIGGTYVYNQASKDSGLDSIYIISISRAEPAKFRIDNPSNGTVYITQIITRTTNPALLDAPVVGVATAVNSTHFTANWTAVTHATGYKIRVYQGTTNVKTVDVSGQATESVQVTELTPETEYTFKVQAIGNDYVDFADSFLSSASAPVMTGITSGLDSQSELKLAVSGKTITASEPGMFEVYNMQGAKLHQVKNVDMAETNLPTGLYILQFTGVNGQQTTKKISIN